MDIFCKIINNEIPSYKIYEDEKVLAFLDINPSVDGHTLIIPKQHYKDLYDLDNETFIHIINIAKKIGPLLEEKLHADGITLTQNNGLYQEVKHFHLHVKPQYKEKKELKSLEEIYKIITK